MSRAGTIVLRSIIGLVILLLVAVVALIVFIYTFDANRLRPWVDDKVSQALQRPFAINGDLVLKWRKQQSGETGWRAWVPWPEFTAHDITIGNPPWTKRKQFATLDQVNFEIEALPLLEHRIVIPAVQLVNPAIDLERRHDGSNNWSFKLKPSEQPSTWKLDLQTIGFASGKLAYSDAIKRADLQATVNTLGKPLPLAEALKQEEARARAQAPVAAKPTHPPAVKQHPAAQAYALGWKATGSYNGAALSGDGKIGSVLDLRDIEMPFPIQADLKFSNKTHIAVVGTLTDPLNLAALDLRLWLSGISMSHLYPLTGLTLPDTPPYATDGHVSGRIKAGANEFRYEHFSGRVGGSDLSGTLLYRQRQPRPLLSGSLESKLLRFVDLGPLIGADSNASKRKRGVTTQQPAGKALPVQGFRTERWKAMDADVRFTGKRIIRKASLPIDNLYTHLIMKDGVLALAPLDFGVAGGTLTSNVRLDGSSAPLKGKADVMARHIKLRQLFPTLQVMQTSLGEINGDAVLAANGNSIASLMASSNGEVKALMSAGAISGTLLEEAGLNVVNIVMLKLFGDKPVQIHCAASDFVVNNGVLNSRMFAVDTDTALITMDGTINLGTEQINLVVHPQSKGLRLVSLRSPIYVKGTFKQPNVGVDMGSILLKGAAAVGLGVIAAPLAALVPLTALSPQQQAPCQTMLAQMRQPPKVPAHRAKARSH